MLQTVCCKISPKKAQYSDNLEINCIQVRVRKELSRTIVIRKHNHCIMQWNMSCCTCGLAICTISSYGASLYLSRTSSTWPSVRVSPRDTGSHMECASLSLSSHRCPEYRSRPVTLSHDVLWSSGHSLGITGPNPQPQPRFGHDWVAVKTRPMGHILVIFKRIINHIGHLQHKELRASAFVLQAFT